MKPYSDFGGRRGRQIAGDERVVRELAQLELRASGVHLSE